MRHPLPTVLALMLAACGVSLAGRTVAVTLDDLPFTGEPTDAARVEAAGRAIVDALVRHRVPASGFVTGRNVLVEGQADMRAGLLRHWADAGLFLENHGFSHLSYARTPRREYLDDLVMGQAFPRRALEPHGRSVAFYRAPYNHTGTTPEDKRALLDFLEERKLRLAPFTVEHADYMFNKLYADAAGRPAADDGSPGGIDDRPRIGAAYLEQLDIAFDFAEGLSRDTFDREIPQVFLIHTNLINADYLDRMLAAIAKRGYGFVSLEEALEDPAYASAETYAGPHGISWFHRWRSTRGLPNRLRDEPDPPAWVLEAYRQATRDAP